MSRRSCVNSPVSHRLLHVLAQVRVELLGGPAQALDGEVEVLSSRGFRIGDYCAAPVSSLDGEDGDLPAESG